MLKAYIVTAYHKVHLLNGFLEQLLKDPEADVYLHIDKRHDDLKKDVIKNDRIFYADAQYEINWGSDELLKVILALYHQILESRKAYEYVIVTTGQDVMVRRGLDDFLKAHKGQVFIDAFYSEAKNKYKRAILMHKWPAIYKRKYDFKFHPVRIMRSTRIRLFCLLGKRFEKKVDYDVDSVTFYYDFHWNAMPLEAIRWLCQFVDEHPGYWAIFDGSFMCEEAFFTTTIKLGPYADRIIMEGNRSQSLTYTGETVNNHPVVLTMKDIEDIENSGRFFARKFDDAVDERVIEYFRKETLDPKTAKE